VVSATLLAVTVCVPADDGGEYTPEALTVPTEELPLGMESTSHVAVVTGFPVTVAVNVWACPVVSATRTGLIATDAVPPPTEAVIVIVVEARLLPSFTEVAVAVTAAGVGTAAGAV
jgi:hypothetical protein